MFEKFKKFFETKQRTWLSYRWSTYWLWDSIETNIDLYYKLYRQNTDLRRCIEELYQTVWKDWYILKSWENVLKNSSLNNILNYHYWFNNFKALIIRDLQISWNVFIIPVKSLSNKLLWFQILDPRTMRVIANKFGEVIKYIQIKWWTQITFEPWEIYHFKDILDQDNEIFWISKIETLVYSILSDKESERSNYAFFKNNAIPSTIITLDNELDENELKIALSQLQKQFSGWENKHRVSASTWIKDVKVIWNTIKDMEFLWLRGFTTERICAAVWVPKTILGYSEHINYSTSDNQYRKYIENTINPLNQTIENIISVLISEFNISFEFIKNNDYDLKEKIERYEKLVNIGVMTINEVRFELWYNEYIEENANKPFIKNWYTLIEDIGADLINNWQTIINDNTV